MAAADKIVQGAEPGNYAESLTLGRPDALSWDDYFMCVAFLTAMRSKDPSTQVGACIVNDLNRIIGIGYNGFPSGIPEGVLPWAKSPPKDSLKVLPEAELATKHPYVVHAEVNAIMNKNAETCRGGRLYTTLFPCNECAKVIIQAGITQVVFASDKHHRRITTRASRELFRLAGVATRRHVPREAGLWLALRYPEDEPSPEPGSAREAHGEQVSQLCQCCFFGTAAGPPRQPPAAPESGSLAEGAGPLWPISIVVAQEPMLQRLTAFTTTATWAAAVAVPLACGMVVALLCARR